MISKIPPLPDPDQHVPDDGAPKATGKLLAASLAGVGAYMNAPHTGDFTTDQANAKKAASAAFLKTWEKLSKPPPATP